MGKKDRPIVAVDFDGVLHAFSRGWADGTIYDPPLPGAREAMERLMACGGYEVVVYSSRANFRLMDGVACDDQADEMRKWLNHHGIPFDRVWTWCSKPPYEVLIDDRAVRFQSWKQAIFDLVCLGILPSAHDEAASHAPGPPVGDLGPPAPPVGQEST